MKKLSFVVAAYNVEKYIADCLRSILALNINFDFEILVINDGSTDKTIFEIESVVSDSIRVFNIKNSGVSFVRNLGIKKSLGEYIFFVDGDDLINKKDFEILLRELNSDFDVIIGGFNTLDSKGLYNKNNESDIIFSGSGVNVLNRYFFNQISPSIWKCFFKLETLKNNNCYFLDNIAIAEDGEWFVRVLFNSNYVYFNNNLKIYNYRLREGSVMLSDYTYRKFNDTLIVVKSLINIIIFNKLGSKDRRVFDLYACSLLYNNIVMYKGEVDQKDISRIKFLVNKLNFVNIKSFIFLLLMRINTRIAIILLKNFS